MRYLFCLFYTRYKKYPFFVKLDVCISNVETYTLNFCSNFLTFIKCFFSNRSICSHVPIWISDKLHHSFLCTTYIFFFDHKRREPRPSTDKPGANLKARQHRSIRRGTCVRVLRFSPELSSRGAAFPSRPPQRTGNPPPARSRYDAGHAASGSPPPSLLTCHLSSAPSHASFFRSLCPNLTSFLD
jgi:hypothetical protein